MTKARNRTGKTLMLGVFLIFGILQGTTSMDKTRNNWPGTETSFHGFKQYDFTLEDMSCTVVVPDQTADGKPWIWRARFFGHEPQTDIACLEKGFHVAYVEVGGLFGSPKAVAKWDAFYGYLTGNHGFSEKPVLEGMSRGGLIIFNWAAANPGKVSCIYADAPVCDFKSWPGGKGKGPGSAEDWIQCLEAYEMTEAEALAYPYNPIDNLEPLATAGIPLLHVVGDKDEVVPVEDNTDVLEKRYKKLGGSICVIHKKEGKHHPHSLEDPRPIVDFILSNVSNTSLDPESPVNEHGN